MYFIVPLRCVFGNVIVHCWGGLDKGRGGEGARVAGERGGMKVSWG